MAGTMRHLSVDIETFSDEDIRKTGSYRYALSPEFDILLIAYAVDDGNVQMIDLTEAGDSMDEMLLEDFLSLMYADDVMIHAYNAAFEFWCINVWLKRRGLEPIPVSKYRCTMVHGLYCGYTAGLGVTGEVLGIPQDKKKLSIGSALIRTFCVPAKPTKSDPNRTRIWPHDEPEKWALFKMYCMNDVEAERAIEKMLSVQPIPAYEQKVWEMDITVNSEGVMVDMDLVNGALEINRANTDALIDEAKRITGIENPNSVSQLLAWLQKNDVETETLRKADVQELLSAGVESKDVERMLYIRQQLGKTSCKKYDAIVNCVCADDRIRGMMQYYAANRSGRFGGRLLQPQNLPQNHLEDLPFARELVKDRDADALRLWYGDSVPDTLSQLIRTTLVPKKGNRFVVADYSAIECRVVAWLAGQQSVLDTFIRGGDIYCATASGMFGVPVAKHGPNAELRQKGKIATLACVAGDTLVVTNNGVVPITKVRPSDLIFDGYEFVRHSGVVYQGEKEVIRVDGFRMTHDHKILTTDGWVNACESNGLLWDPILIGRDMPITVCESATITDVYDVLCCGQRNQYAIVDPHLDRIRIVHNCGYGGGPAALVAMGALKMGIPEEDLPDIVNRWRDSNPYIVDLWSKVGSAAMNTLKTGSENRLEHGIVFRREVDPATKQDWMTIEMPSGRKLFYAKPSIAPAPKNPSRKSIHYMQQNQTTRKWEDCDTWGGKLVENCLSEGTMVLTYRGLVPIEQITDDDLVWDGDYWVSHSGLIDNGVRDTILVDGIRMTPEHKVSTTEGWRRCGESDGLDWEAVRLPYRDMQNRIRPKDGEIGVDVHMCMRERDRKIASGCYEEEESHQIVRMHEIGPDFEIKVNTRDVETSGVRCMALDGTEMHRTDASRVEELRRTRNRSMRKMDPQFREFLGGHGTDMGKGIGSGQDKQRSWIQSPELPVDDKKDKFKESTVEQIRGLSDRENDSCGTERKVRNRSNDTSVSTGTRLADRITVNETRLQKRVYDLSNCGPRRCFTVYDTTTGKYRIVHNCVQAVARDLLVDTLMRLYEAGFVPRFHVHDEVIIEAPADEADDVLKMLLGIMASPPDWAEGLPLKGAGFVCDFYQKD